jgi:4'-phosphopantetheinyl transferase
MTTPTAGVGVEVWWVGVGAARDEFVRDLDDVERGRLAAYLRDVDKARFLLGVTLVRRVLAERFSLPAAKVALDRTCPECGKPHGKVRAAGVELSVTHSGDLVGVAVAERPVGLDVEKIDLGVDVDAVARVAFTDAEVRALGGYDGIAKARAFTTYWTRKEAVVKATGEGLRGDLRAERRVEMRGEWRVAEGDVQVRDLEVGAEHCAALAVISAERPVVQVQDGARLLG